MTNSSFPQPPRKRGGIIDPYELSKWFDKIRNYFIGLPGLDFFYITNRKHTLLEEIGVNTHAQIDTAVSASTSHIADTSIHHTLEDIQDDMATFLTAGLAITLTYDDAGNKLTIDVKQMAAQADSVAATVAALRTDFNALLANLRTSELLAP